jgi:hypothetical protein
MAPAGKFQTLVEHFGQAPAAAPAPSPHAAPTLHRSSTVRFKERLAQIFSGAAPTAKIKSRLREHSVEEVPAPSHADVASAHPIAAAVAAPIVGSPKTDVAPTDWPKPAARSLPVSASAVASERSTPVAAPVANGSEWISGSGGNQSGTSGTSDSPPPMQGHSIFPLAAEAPQAGLAPATAVLPGPQVEPQQPDFLPEDRSRNDFVGTKEAKEENKIQFRQNALLGEALNAAPAQSDFGERDEAAKLPPAPEEFRSPSPVETESRDLPGAGKSSRVLERAEDQPAGKSADEVHGSRDISPLFANQGPAIRAVPGKEISAAPVVAVAGQRHVQPATVENGVKPPTPDSTSNPPPAALSGKSGAGTAVAQQETTMKMAAKKTDFSGREQKLPAVAGRVGGATIAAGKNLPAAVKGNDAGGMNSPRSSAPATITIRVGPAAPLDPAAVASETPAQKISPETMELPRLITHTVLTAERTQELVVWHALRLRASGADEMHVVIQPDSELQLSLYLQQRHGEVEARAVLERGNFEWLNRHWPELQQQLELRGVRLAPLAGAHLSFGGGSAGFRHPSQHPHGQQTGDSIAAAPPSPATLPGSPPAAATASASGIASRRWEKWA